MASPSSASNELRAVFILNSLFYYDIVIASFLVNDDGVVAEERREGGSEGEAS